MFTPAVGQGSAVADLSAQVAALRGAVKLLTQRVSDLEASIASALEAVTPSPMTPKSDGTDSGETVE